MRGKVILFVVLGLIFSSTLSWAGLHFGIHKAVKSGVEKLDKKVVEKEEKEKKRTTTLYLRDTELDTLKSSKLKTSYTSLEKEPEEISGVLPTYYLSGEPLPLPDEGYNYKTIYLLSGDTKDWRATLESNIEGNTYSFSLFLAGNSTFKVTILIDHNGVETELASTQFTVTDTENFHTFTDEVQGKTAGVAGDVVILRVTVTSGSGYSYIRYGNGPDAEDLKAHITLQGSILVSLPPTPDLVVSSLGQATYSSNYITGTYTIKNQGSGSAGSFKVYFYLSSDTTITTGDTYLGYINISGLSVGASISGNYSFYRSSSPSGYYIGAIVDPDNYIAESNENNNTAYNSIQVVAPDLVVSSLGQATYSSSDQSPGYYYITGTYTVKNQGNGNAGSFDVYSYLSPDTTITTGDTQLGYMNIPSLSAGASIFGNYFYSRSSSPAGYYIGAIVDPYNSIVESNENNNTAYNSINEVTSVITVTSPNGVENWQQNASYSITWRSSGVGNQVKIDLYKGGSFTQTIVSSTYNNGSYSWLVPITQTIGTDYKIRVTSTSNSSIYDESDSNFSITACPIITVISPNGVESWQRGTSHSITWNSSGVGSSVKIDLYKGGVFNTTIDSYEDNDGLYPWSIPTNLAAGIDYKIKVTDYYNSSTYDYSDSNFSITATITVTSPNGGESWQRGTSHSITWSSIGVGSSVKIELYKGGVWNSTINSSTSNNGLYSWLIPINMAAGIDYKIKVTDYNDSGTYDYSDSNFSITATITVTSPNGGESWGTGTSHSITWNSNRVGSYVKSIGTDSYVEIELYKGGILNGTISSYEYNDGSYSWLIPTSLANGDDYKIKITDYYDSSIYDYSDSNFSITSTTTSGDAYEPDNAYSQAKTIYSGIRQTHSIVPATDVDWVKFTLSSTSNVVIETSGSSGDTQMWLYNSSLNQIEYDDDDGTDGFSYISRTGMSSGTYYVKIDEYGNNDEIPIYYIDLTISP
ncbi:MAG: CARDB domain-containing protein [bacterium]